MRRRLVILLCRGAFGIFNNTSRQGRKIWPISSSSSSSCRAGSTDIPDPLTTFPYRSSPPAGLLDYIPFPHIVAECMFVLVVLLLFGHMWGSIRVHHLIVFHWNHFEMRLLNLRINFYLLRTFCPHLGSFLCCFFFQYVSAKNVVR